MYPFRLSSIYPVNSVETGTIGQSDIKRVAEQSRPIYAPTGSEPLTQSAGNNEALASEALYTIPSVLLVENTESHRLRNCCDNGAKEQSTRHLIAKSYLDDHSSIFTIVCSCFFAS
jgi:hypothetical protein